MHVVVGNFQFQRSTLSKIYPELGTVNCITIGMKWMQFYTNGAVVKFSNDIIRLGIKSMQMSSDDYS